jgi:hypothetical protein
MVALKPLTHVSMTYLGGQKITASIIYKTKTMAWLYIHLPPYDDGSLHIATLPTGKVNYPVVEFTYPKMDVSAKSVKGLILNINRDGYLVSLGTNTFRLPFDYQLTPCAPVCEPVMPLDNWSATSRSGTKMHHDSGNCRIVQLKFNENPVLEIEESAWGGCRRGIK